MSGRLECLNPRCGRTSSQDKYPDATSIVCGKCWRTLPKRLTQRYRQLRKRQRRIARLFARERRSRPDLPAGTMNRRMFVVDRQIDRLTEENWRAIYDFFHAVDRPEGLDAFLEEVGLVSVAGNAGGPPP